MDTLGKIQKLLEDNPAPMTIKNKTMVPRDTEAKVPFYRTLAGGKVCDDETGEEVLTHEYDHKSFQNLIYSLSER